MRFTLLITLLAPPLPAGEVLLTKNDMFQIQSSVWVAAGLELSEPDEALPIVGSGASGDGARLLRIYNARGPVNGFNGVIYDNRDRGHSSLDPDYFPRLARLKYDADLVAEGFDVGLAGRVILPAVVLGNSSMALRNGSARRSLPRLAMTNAFWRTVTPILYSSNHIYVYPEHRDYDAEDRFPINWPYMIVSQGSSGSDKGLIYAIAVTLAALPRDTFEFLKENGLVAPTVQMILRRNFAPVATRSDYLSGVAHPAVFEPRLVRSGRMVEMAADLRPEHVPPVVKLRVLEEDFSETAGLKGLDERLLDSPAAIGRAWRSFAWEREIVVTTEDTAESPDRPVTFEWRLLRGDPDLVSIEPRGGDGRTARIRVSWHAPWSETMPGRRGDVNRSVSRVDIGVFANNGVHDSAPSFISIDFPRHQIRQYSTGTDGIKRLLSVDYDAEGRGVYFDPLLYWTAPWTDTARYDKNGNIAGWDRLDAEGVSMGFIQYEGAIGTPLGEKNQGN